LKQKIVLGELITQVTLFIFLIQKFKDNIKKVKRAKSPEVFYTGCKAIKDVV
jgi:hypothetical protein